MEVYSSGLTLTLVRTALLTFAAVYLLCRRVLGVRLSLAVAAIRVAIPFTYFAWWYDPDWTHIDGVQYFTGAIRLLEGGYTPLVLTSPPGIEQLQAAADGWHILYYWWNMVAIELFGAVLYAPIFLNVVLSVAVALLFVRLLSPFEFPASYRRWLFAFVTLHWSVLTWSSINNVKMYVVIFLTLIALYGAYEVIQSDTVPRIVFGVGVVAVSSLGLFNVRFYVPAFLFGAVAVWALFNGRSRVRSITLAGAAVGGTVFLWFGRTSLHRLDPEILAYGFVRILLTPRPWGTTVHYTYLEPAMWLHWLTLPAALVGLWYLQRESARSTVLLVFLFFALSFYAIFPKIQGVRHREWLYLFFAWGLFHFVWRLRSRLTVVRTDRL